MINNWSEGLLHAVDVPPALLVWCVMSPELTNASPSPGTCIMVIAHYSTYNKNNRSWNPFRLLAGRRKKNKYSGVGTR